MARKFSRVHNGVTYVGSEDRENLVTGSITNGQRKWTLKGCPKINAMKGSYKHGDEVQITVWGTYGSTTERERVRFEQDGSAKIHKWETVEIFFPAKVWHDLVRKFYEKE